MLSIKEILFKKTAQDTGIIFAGTLVNAALGGVFFILVPRILGPKDYGIFATIAATAIFVLNFANLGIDTGILRFAVNPKLANKIFSLSFKLYIALGFIILLLGIPLSTLFAKFLTHVPPNLLRLAFASTLLLLLTNFFISALQARGQFLKASIVSISSNFFRLVILLIALAFIKVGLNFIAALFFFIPLVSIIFGKIFLPFNFEKTDRSLFKEFFKYNSFIALSIAISSIPFDNYLLIKIVGPAQAGFYAAPFKVLTFVQQFSSSFSRVLASRFASFDKNEKAILFALKSSPITILVSISLIILAIAAPIIVKIIFGNDYLDSVLVFRVLAFAFVFFFLSTIPQAIILYYFGHSQISFIITIARNSIFVALLLYLVKNNGALGAAWAYLAAESANLTLTTFYCFYKFAKNE